MLLSYKLQMDEFKKKNPYNILNINKDDVFHRVKTEDYVPNEDETDYMIYDRENYDEQIKAEYSKRGIDYDYNAMFEASKQSFIKQIRDNMKMPTIIRDPNTTKYTDTYSQTPYATFMLTPLSGREIENILYRDHNDIIYCEDEMSATSCKEHEVFENKRQCRPSGCTARHCCRKKSPPPPVPPPVPPSPPPPPPTPSSSIECNWTNKKENCDENCNKKNKICDSKAIKNINYNKFIKDNYTCRPDCKRVINFSNRNRDNKLNYTKNITGCQIPSTSNIVTFDVCKNKSNTHNTLCICSDPLE